VWGGAARRWLGRWLSAVAAALVPIVPTGYVLAHGIHSPGFVPGAGAARPGALVGVSWANFIGSVDPYLFRATDVTLSPSPWLRGELAILLTAGLAVLLLAPRVLGGLRLDRFRRWFVAAAVVLIGVMAVSVTAAAGWAPARTLDAVTSAGELSIWLFVWYGFVAALPLAIAFDRIGAWIHAAPSTAPARRVPPPASRHGRAGRLPAARAIWPIVLALAIVVPGIALTPAQVAPTLATLYGDFGNVTADDFALLAYLGGHLPAGARLLVAPGSAAEFAPAYCANLTMLYPMVPGWPTLNDSYALVVRELTNDTLDSAGLAAMAILHVQYVAVTGANTVLWPPFASAPLRADPGRFTLLFHAGPDDLFGVRG